MSIDLHAGQSAIINSLFVTKECRYGVVCASRGFGKSFLASVAAILAVQELMAMDADVPNKNVAIICPTYQQAVDIYFPLLAYQLGLGEWADKMSQHSGTFWFPNNVILKLWSYEASNRMRGSGQYFVICDETTSWKGGGSSAKETWESVVQPCLTTRWSEQMAEKYNAPSAGRALIISTPLGRDYFYDQFNFQEVDDQWKSWRFTYRDSPYLDPDEIEKTKHTIDALKFQREYEASFDDSGNTVFYNFSRDEHVTRDVDDFSPGETVNIALDFNVGVMAATAFAVRGDEIHLIEDFSGSADTETFGKMIKKKYLDKGHPVSVFPDPSGRARKSSAAVGRTDFTILQNFGFATFARRKAPPMADSVQAVNRMLKTADGQCHMFIHPRCKDTITSIERTSWKETNPDVMTIDKSEGIEHWTDGIRYAVEYLFPVQSHTKRQHRGFNF